MPLPTQAVKLFRELHLLTGTGELCFPGRHSASQCISDMALLNGIRRMGFSKEEMTIHGFRAMFSTILNEKKLEWGFDGDIIEAQLAHKEQNTVRDAYNHASYLDKRRELLQRWADYVDELRNKDTSNSLKYFSKQHFQIYGRALWQIGCDALPFLSAPPNCLPQKFFLKISLFPAPLSNCIGLHRTASHGIAPHQQCGLIE